MDGEQDALGPHDATPWSSPPRRHNRRHDRVGHPWQEVHALLCRADA
ncbi:MAG: hypothetical protein ACJ8AI_32360 [Rhodopila sp.]